MADSKDSSLDDFFAKKDKRIKKSKTKTGPADVDDGSKAIKKDKKKKSDKTNNGTGLSNTQAVVKDDEEWRDFEDEKEIDYSGLKIQNMQISKEEQEKENDDDENEEDEDGEPCEKRSGASGPWNKSNEPKKGRKKEKAPAPVPVAAPEPAKEETPTAPKGPSKYVPPGARHAALSGSSNTPNFPSSRGRKKEAPNMHSEEDFPTLGGGPGGPRSNYPPQYSNTGGADLIDNAGGRKGVKLTLANKFSALQD